MKRSGSHRHGGPLSRSGIWGGICAAVVGLLLLAVTGWSIATDTVTESCPQGSPLADSGVEGC